MGKEKYTPKPDEIKRAEELMTDDQKRLSEAREEGYNLAKSERSDLAKAIDEASPKKVNRHKSEQGESYELKDPKEPYHERATVNGTEIRVHWDSGYGDYVIYFPQIEIDDEAYKKGVHDQVLRLTRRPDVAKEVFDYAKARAAISDDVYEIFKEVKKFSRDIPYELKEDGE